MPNTREKLIELMKDTRNNAAWHHWGYEESADHLIANGVRLEEKQATSDETSKWIPVTERLPELHTKVLCCGIKGGRFIAELSTWGKGNIYWDKRNGKGCPEVTHWMPLPQPPKGE